MPARAFLEGRRGAVRELRAASARGDRATRSAGRSTPPASRTSAPRRSSSCCSATSAGPAAASWRCAATPASRARPTSRRCTTSCPATSRCRTRTPHDDLDEFVERNAAGRPGCWATLRCLHRQPAEGWWGAAATPRTTSASTSCRASTATTRTTDGAGGCATARSRASSSSARTRRSARPTRAAAAGAGASSSGWWCATSRDRDARRSGTTRPRSRPASWHRGDRHRGLLPAGRRPHREGAAAFTNTQRLLQWHDKAVEPPGDCRSELWFSTTSAGAIRAKLRRLRRPDATGRSSTSRGTTRREGPHDEPSAEAVLQEIRLRRRRRVARRAISELEGRRLDRCGCWIYSGSTPTASTRPRAASPAREQTWVAPEWGWAWPATAASSTTAPPPTPTGKPWSERKRYVWWDAAAGQLGGPRRARLQPDKPPDYVPPDGRDRPRRRCAATTRSSCRPTATAGCSRPRARRRPAARPTTSRTSRRSRTRCTRQQANPARQSFARRRQPATTRPPASRARTRSRTCSRPTG